MYIDFLASFLARNALSLDVVENMSLYKATNPIVEKLLGVSIEELLQYLGKIGVYVVLQKAVIRRHRYIIIIVL